MSAMIPEEAASQYLQNQRETLKDVCKIFVQREQVCYFNQKKNKSAEQTTKKGHIGQY